MTCDVCGLPDLHHGQGDGIGSCDCPRCDCGTCDPDVDPDAGWDAGWDDDWDDDWDDEVYRPVETITPVGGVL